MFNKDGSNPDRLRYPEHLDEDPGDEDRDLDYWLSELDFSDLDRYDADGEPTGLLLDVPYVPSDSRIVDAMLDLGEVSRDDLLYDLGCGDGRIVVAAALERGARGVGIDMDPERVAEAIDLARYSKVEELTRFYEGDLLEADFSEATVLMMYLLDTVNLELRPRLLQELRPGTRIVSHAFDMADWKPDRQERLGGIELYKWVVPAPVAGDWQWQSRDGDRYRVSLQQKFQNLSGQAWLNDEEVRLHRARLHGDLLELGIKPSHRGKAHNFVMRWQDGELHPVDDHGQDGPARRV